MINKEYVVPIQYGNKALKFIDKRINDDNYRGDKSSEHNRYNLEEIFHILYLLNQYAPNKSLLKIRDTDLSKRPTNTLDEIPYAKFCEDVKMKVGKGSQDSIRKNIFVDLSRMNFINRYDEHKTIIEGDKKQSVKYVSLTDYGIKLINANNLLNQSFIFSRAINTLLKGYVETTLDILQNTNYNLEYITKYEFMFFISAINTKTSFSITIEESVDLIKNYRLLSSIQRKAVIITLKQKMIPSEYQGNKTAKRDWHNWQNKIDQVYHLLKQSPYFDISGKDKDILTLSMHKIKTKEGYILDTMKRSISEKYEYYKNHHVKKTKGFELHHVIPLCWAENVEQYKLFDKWENMIYIDAYNHSIITQNNNRNINMKPLDEVHIILFDQNKNTVKLLHNINILYNPKIREKIFEYNSKLIQTL